MNKGFQLIYDDKNNPDDLDVRNACLHYWLPNFINYMQGFCNIIIIWVTWVFIQKYVIF